MMQKILAGNLARQAPSRKAATLRPAKKSKRRGSPPKPDLSQPVVELVQCEDTLAAALTLLRLRDPKVVERMLAETGPIPLRPRPPDLAGLAWIVVSQQVSTASANAIYARFAAKFPGFDAAALAGGSDDALRACGLSGPKMRTIRALGAAVVDRTLDFEALASMDAEQAHAVLTAIHGIGPWTADIFLLFCLGHPDAWPVGDLALQEAARMALGLRQRPHAKRLAEIGERWRPVRGVAARVLWAWYGVMKKRSVA